MMPGSLKGLLTATHQQRPVAAFLRGALLGYGIQLAGLAVGFAVSVMIARALGPDGRGLYAWMMTLNGLALPFAMVGLDTYIRRRGAGASRAVQGALLGTGSLMVAVAASAVAVILYGVGWQTEIGQGNPRLMALALVFAPLTAVGSVFSLLLIAQRRMLMSNVMMLFSRLVAALCLVALLVAGLVEVRLILVASLLLPALALLAVLGTLYAREGIRPRVDWSVLRGSKRFVGGAYLSTLFVYLLQKQDVLLLGAYTGPAEVGHYSVAVTFIDVLLIAPLLVANFLLPHLQSQPIGVARRMFGRKVMLLTGGALVAVAVAGMAVAHPLVVTLYGQEFEGAVVPLQVLLLAFVFFGLMNLQQSVLALAAKGGALVAAPAAGVVLNLLLNLVWIPMYGGVGAAWASVVSYAAACGVSWWMCRRCRAG